MNDVIISSFKSYYNHKQYCNLEKKMLKQNQEGFCDYIENIGIDLTQMHTNTFKINNVSNKANVTYNGPGVLDIVVELKGSVNDLPYNPEWKRMTDIFLRYVEDFLPLIGHRLMDFLGVRVLYLDGNTFLIEKVVYLYMTTEIYSARELSDNDNWEVDYVFEEINRIKEVMGLLTEENTQCKDSEEAKNVKIKAENNFIREYKEKYPGKSIPFIEVSKAGNKAVEDFCKNELNESKMSEFDLESYKNKHREMGNDEWLDILNRFPEEFQREIVDELPNGSKNEINTIKNWELDPNHPIEMNLLNLLQTDSVKEAIGRTPRHVMEMIKSNPVYRLELKDVKHVSDTEVGREYGLKSGEIFDQNPKRYEEYANYDPKTAEPSTMVDGELWWGTGRLIAALLRGDMTLKVWSVMDNRGVKTDFTG